MHQKRTFFGERYDLMHHFPFSESKSCSMMHKMLPFQFVRQHLMDVLPFFSSESCDPTDRKAPFIGKSSFRIDKMGCSYWQSIQNLIYIVRYYFCCFSRFHLKNSSIS